MGFLCGSDGKEYACNAGDQGLIPGLERSAGGGHGNPLWYSLRENPMDRGAWWATVHGVTKSWTWLKWLSTQQHAKMGKLRQRAVKSSPASSWWSQYMEAQHSGPGALSSILPLCTAADVLVIFFQIEFRKNSCQFIRLYRKIFYFIWKCYYFYYWINVHLSYS